MKATQVSIHRWMDIETVICTESGILFSHKKGMKYEYMLEHKQTFKRSVLTKRSQILKAHIYNSIYVKYSE